jgi:hypothetical protein
MHTALCLYEHKELGSYKNNMSAYQALRLLMKLLYHKRKAVNCWLIKAGPLCSNHSRLGSHDFDEEHTL